MSIGAVIVALAAIVVLNVPHGSADAVGGLSPVPGTSSTGSLPSSTAGPGATPGTTAGMPAINVPATPIPASILRDGRTLGAPTAPVSLEVWADFQCPACGNFSQVVEPVLIERYVAPGKLRLTFHDFAFLGQESEDAASAARCAGEQGKFWEYQTLVYANQQGENQGWFTRARLEAIAVASGVDGALWATCYDGGTQRQAVATETNAGKAAGVRSTPTLFLNGRIVPLETLSSWNDLLTLLDTTIAASGAPSGSPAGPSPSAS